MPSPNLHDHHPRSRTSAISSTEPSIGGWISRSWGLPVRRAGSAFFSISRSASSLEIPFDIHWKNRLVAGSLAFLVSCRISNAGRVAPDRQRRCAKARVGNPSALLPHALDQAVGSTQPLCEPSRRAQRLIGNRPEGRTADIRGTCEQPSPHRQMRTLP